MWSERGIADPGTTDSWLEGYEVSEEAILTERAAPLPSRKRNRIQLPAERLGGHGGGRRRRRRGDGDGSERESEKEKEKGA
jgi:hypothetical protein